MWDNIVLILGSLVYYCLKDNKQQNCNPQSINGFNNCNLFLITQLYYSRLASIVSSSNNFYSYNNTYLETSFIKILDIIVKNPILNNYIKNAFKLGPNKYRILIFSPLIVILTIIFRFQIIIAVNKISHLVLANGNRVALSGISGNQKTSHLPYGCNPRRYTTSIH